MSQTARKGSKRRQKVITFIHVLLFEIIFNCVTPEEQVVCRSFCGDDDDGFQVNTAIQLLLVASSLAAPVFQYTDSVLLQCLW